MQTIKYLRLQATDKKIMVGLGLNSGNPEAAIITYLQKHPNITVAYMDAQLFGNKLAGIDCLISNQPVYFVGRTTQQAGLEKYLQAETVITNSSNSDFHTIYTLKTPCLGKPLNISPIKT